MRSLKKHGIAYEPARVHDGDFWYNMGEKTAEDILSSPLPRPQAVVCACDTQAISLCDAFAHRGIKVPEDIKITGYDSIKAGTNHVPSITSAEIPAKQTGANAVEYLHSVIENKPFEPGAYSTDIVLAQTFTLEDNHKVALFRELTRMRREPCRSCEVLHLQKYRFHLSWLRRMQQLVQRSCERHLFFLKHGKPKARMEEEAAFRPVRTDFSPMPEIVSASDEPSNPDAYVGVEPATQDATSTA